MKPPSIFILRSFSSTERARKCVKSWRFHTWTIKWLMGFEISSIINNHLHNHLPLRHIIEGQGGRGCGGWQSDQQVSVRSQDNPAIVLIRESFFEHMFSDWALASSLHSVMSLLLSIVPLSSNGSDSSLLRLARQCVHPLATRRAHMHSPIVPVQDEMRRAEQHLRSRNWLLTRCQRISQLPYTVI